MMVLIHGEEVNGVNIDGQTRCAHYHTAPDIVAIKFRCCKRWFACFECHAETAGHEARAWPVNERDSAAILCGKCGYQLSIDEYFASSSTCPACHSNFNPGCANHYHLYFQI